MGLLLGGVLGLLLAAAVSGAIRAASGVLYLAGVVVFVYNLVMTARRGEPVAAPRDA